MKEPEEVNVEIQTLRSAFSRFLCDKTFTCGQSLTILRRARHYLNRAIFDLEQTVNQQTLPEDGSEPEPYDPDTHGAD